MPGELTGKGLEPDSTIAVLHKRAVIAQVAGESVAEKVFPLHLDEPETIPEAVHDVGPNEEPPQAVNY